MGDLLSGGETIGALGALAVMGGLMVRVILAQIARTEREDSGVWQMLDRHERTIKDLREENRTDRHRYEQQIVTERHRYEEELVSRDALIDALQEESRELRAELQILRRAQQRGLPPPTDSS